MSSILCPTAIIQTAQIFLNQASLDSTPASLYVPSRGLKIIQLHMAAEDRWVVWPYLARLRGVEALVVLYSRVKRNSG